MGPSPEDNIACGSSAHILRVLIRAECAGLFTGSSAGITEVGTNASGIPITWESAIRSEPTCGGRSVSAVRFGRLARHYGSVVMLVCTNDMFPSRLTVPIEI
jgi:hypothetical protein